VTSEAQFFSSAVQHFFLGVRIPLVRARGEVQGRVLQLRRRQRQVIDDSDHSSESLRTERDVQSAYAKYGGELFGFAMNALDDRQLSEEVVQETFVRAWRSAGY
jgi:hypothetical protein